jgi:4-hydroxy-tetrahydrodipicolinate synthase
LLEYTRHLIAELPLPLFIYNMPSLTKVSYELSTLEALMDEPNVPGVKDSSGNMTYFHRVCRLLKGRPDWSLLIGPEELLLDAVLAGGHGGVNGGANLFPELYVRLHQTAAAGDFVRAREIHDVVMEVAGTLYHVGRHSSAIIKGLKCALSCAGVCDDFMAEPFHRFRGDERRRIEELLVVLDEKVKSVLR